MFSGRAMLQAGFELAKPSGANDRHIIAPVRPKLNRFVFLTLLAAIDSASAHEAVPFRTRNLSPLVSVFGIPAWHKPDAPLELSVTTELANHYRLSQRGPDRLIADAETLRTSLFAAKRLGENWSVSLELPYYRVYGGVLDDVIDSWHSAFNLPDGGRNNRAEGLVDFHFAHAGDEFYTLDGRGTGLGDVQIGFAYSLGDFGVATATVKLPTGDEALLAGSGSTDWAVSFLRTRDVQLRRRRAGYYWGAGIIGIGAGPASAFGQRDRGYFGVLGGSLRLAPRLGVRAQLDVHSPMYRSLLEEIGEKAFQGSIGGWWEFSERGVFEFAFNEDLEVSTSPDIVVHMNARWIW